MKKIKTNFLKISIAILGLICLALPFCFASNKTANAEASTFSFSGAGTKSSPYLITNATDMRNFAIYVNNGNPTSGVYFELTSDISLYPAYSNWTPIGRESTNSFAGIFNGNGHTISNMTITATSQYVGLFGYVGSSATLTNFEMENVDIYGLVSSTFYVGSVLGYCAGGKVEISKVYVSSGTIDVSSSNESPIYIGGIVGCSTSSGLTIQQCWTNVEIANTTTNRGSIWNGSYGLVIDCYSLQNLQIGNNELNIKYSYYYYPENQFYTYYTDQSSNQRTYYVSSADIVYDYLKTKSTNWFLSGNDLLLKNVGNVYTLTEAEITVIPRYFDVSTNTWQNGTSNLATLNLSSTISSSIAINTPANTSTAYLPAFTTAYFNFENGSNNVPITTTSFTCNTTYLEYAEAGYTLYVNYTNGVKINLDSEEYWLCKTDNKIYKLTETTSTELTTSNLPSQENKYFLGYSGENTSVVGEWNGTDWYCDATLLITAERSGLDSTPIDYSITAIDFSTLASQDFSSYSIDSPFTLFSVWGSDNVRAHTAVYKNINGVYTKISNYHISCETATTTAEYISIEKNQAYTFAIKNSSNIMLDTSKVGYQIEWYVGTIADNTKTPLGSEYGSLSSTNLVTTEFSNTTAETNILVVLTPRTDIGIEILINDFEGKDNIAIKLNNEVFDLQTLTYGEVYTIKIENIPSGYYISSVNAQSGIETTFDINSQTSTITFTADFNENITITINVLESIFNNIYFYLVVAMGIVAVVIAITLPATNVKVKK